MITIETILIEACLPVRYTGEGKKGMYGVSVHIPYTLEDQLAISCLACLAWGLIAQTIFGNKNLGG